jgi:hypothetical protein
MFQGLCRGHVPRVEPTLLVRPGLRLRVLQGVAGCYRVLQGVTGCYKGGVVRRALSEECIQ